MIKIALTGSIGMGKSTVAAMFARAGIPVFDADAEVRRMQAPGGSLVAPIAARFPTAASGAGLDRDELAQLVLSDPAELAALEVIVHPAVLAARGEFMAQHADEPALLFDIPLLFETGGEGEVDTIIVASAPASVQRARVLQRPGMTSAKLDSILARQLPDSDKCARADYIVDTGTDLSTTEARVDAIIACLGLAARG